MGAWDYGPFDNDGAWDCVGALAKDDPAKVAEQLTEAMGEVLDNEDYIENPEAQGAVAAAVLIANRLGAPAANDRIAEILEAHPFTATDELRTQALRVLDRLREPDTNEWHDLWLDSGALEKVLDLLAPYREVLAGTANA
ncbi:DUF4259 domain-containing protein [Glycomyces harbinensis]|uniref:DUF4259 domain-containing protein n=1 Tax=Glycomyces harbinensis TaxID=58114 RepID=A0A1G6SPT5_9ACTN|nr:DUF4259 domain-containing protein [Glycomyces harbinensis]SDD18156.1 protein of unknown function [Glycomyces harbinensis]